MWKSFISAALITIIAIIIYEYVSIPPAQSQPKIIHQSPVIDLSQAPKFQEAFKASPHLNFTGVYEGILPCADCEGTKVILELFSNHTYKRTITKLGLKEQGYSQGGSFFWDESGLKIELKDQANSKYQFKDTNLYQLGISGVECLSYDGKPFVLEKNISR